MGVTLPAFRKWLIRAITCQWDKTVFSSCLMHILTHHQETRVVHKRAQSDIVVPPLESCWDTNNKSFGFQKHFVGSRSSPAGRVTHVYPCEGHIWTSCYWIYCCLIVKMFGWKLECVFQVTIRLIPVSIATLVKVLTRYRHYDDKDKLPNTWGYRFNNILSFWFVLKCSSLWLFKVLAKGKQSHKRKLVLPQSLSCIFSSL